MVIERVHLQFCKRLLGVKQTTQNDFIYVELGRTSLVVERHLRIIKYWLKICMSNENKYIKHNLLRADVQANPTQVNWMSLVRDLLCNLGMQYAWLEQSVGNVNIFLSLIRQRLTDNFIQNWNSRINESTRALCYKNISSFSFKAYLDTVTVRKISCSSESLKNFIPSSRS